MKRVLALVALLISGVAFADGFYVEGGVAELQQYKQKQTCIQISEVNLSPKGGYSVLVPVDSQCSVVSTHDINDVRNPYGSFAFGYDWRWRAIVVDFQFQRQTSMSVGDHGQNMAKLSLRWYPFSR